MVVGYHHFRKHPYLPRLLASRTPAGSLGRGKYWPRSHQATGHCFWLLGFANYPVMWLFKRSENSEFMGLLELMELRRLNQIQKVTICHVETIFDGCNIFQESGGLWFAGACMEPILYCRGEERDVKHIKLLLWGEVEDDGRFEKGIEGWFCEKSLVKGML